MDNGRSLTPQLKAPASAPAIRPAGRPPVVERATLRRPPLAQAEVGIALGGASDAAVETADVVLLSSRLMSLPRGIALSRAALRCIRQNLFWAFFYNALLIPVAAGALIPSWGLSLSPVAAAAAMSLSSVFVVANSLRLKTFR